LDFPDSRCGCDIAWIVLIAQQAIGPADGQARGVVNTDERGDPGADQGGQVGVIHSPTTGDRPGSGSVGHSSRILCYHANQSR